MISARQLQSSYNKLYECLRNYIWPYDIVNTIAELEISVYNTFPSTSEILIHFTRLKNFCKMYLNDDKELTKALSSFDNTLKQADSGIYAKLDVRLQGVN